MSMDDVKGMYFAAGSRLIAYPDRCDCFVDFERWRDDGSDDG